MIHWINLLAERMSGSSKINMGFLCTFYIWSGMHTYSAEAPTNQEMIGKLFSTGLVFRGTDITTFCLILSKGLLWQLPYNPWTKCFRWLVTSSEHHVQSCSQGQGKYLEAGYLCHSDQRWRWEVETRSVTSKCVCLCCWCWRGSQQSTAGSLEDMRRWGDTTSVIFELITGCPVNKHWTLLL